MDLEIVTIGDELLLAFTIDTNAAHLARELAALGMRIVRRATVGDEPGGITTAIREALERTGAVITTGGLGPTADGSISRSTPTKRWTPGRRSLRRSLHSLPTDACLLNPNLKRAFEN